MPDRGGDRAARAFDRSLGVLFNNVADAYDRVRPSYPEDMFADLVTIAGLTRRSSLLEVGCGTGQATMSLAALGCPLGCLLDARSRLARAASGR